MSDADEMAAKSKRLAKMILDALDEPEDPERVAYEFQKDKADREALERFYVATGQKQPSSEAPLIAAWDYSRAPEAALGMYAVGPGGGSRVAYKDIPDDKRDATAADLRKRGVRLGGFYGGHELVWVADERGVAVWSKGAVKVEGTRDLLTLPAGAVRTSDVAAVVSFVDDDHVRRGVRLELVNGKSVTLVDEQDEIAQLDPTYGRTELLASDAWWVSVLGRDVAAALRVPHRDDAFGLASDPAIVAALRDLAERIERLAPAGAFEAVEIGFTGQRGKATLAFAPVLSDLERRFVEVRVSTPGGSVSSQWLATGSNEILAAHLRRPDAVAEVDHAMKELAESQQRQRLR